jgi:hypothetical protein
MRRSRWLLAASVACAVGLAASPARAADDDDEDPGPWSRGTIIPSLGFGASFGPDLHVLSFGLGASYFVWHGLAVGLDVFDTVYIYRDDFKREFPGIDKPSPTNEVLLLPTLQYVFLRRMRFSPYVIGGLGPVFYNHKRGTVGQWLVGAGAYIRLWGPVALSVGIDFTANFPEDKWKNAFSWDPPPDPVTGEDLGPQSIRGCALIDKPCSFNISPAIGLVFVIGGGKSKRDRDREPPPPAPANPMPEPEIEAEPVEPEPVEPEPVEPEPVESEDAAPPEDAPPPEDLEDAPPEDTPPDDFEDAPPEPDAPPPPETLSSLVRRAP